MPFKPNYRQQRNDRDRAKKAKQDEKLRRREEKAAQRKAELDGSPEGSAAQTDPEGEAAPPADKEPGAA